MKRSKFLPGSAWWSDMASSFIGALLGIAVTFGTSAWIEHRTKQELARKMMAITIDHIDTHIGEMEGICEQLHACDSVFSVVVARYPRQVNRIGTDTLNRFVSCMMSFPLCIEDDSAERIFNQNVEVWKTLDNLRLYSNITNCFSIQRKFYKLYDDLSGARNRVFEKFLEKKHLADYDDTPQLVTALIETLGFRKLLIDLRYTLLQLDMFTQALDAGNENNKLRAGITDDDLDRLFLRNGYEDEFSTTFEYKEQVGL